MIDNAAKALKIIVLLLKSIQTRKQVSILVVNTFTFGT